MDWRKMYDYPTHLPRLREGEVGIFVCKPAWRGRLGTVCALWVKSNTDWHVHEPPGGPPSSAFWTRAHPRGLLVGRGEAIDGIDEGHVAPVFSVEPVTPDPGDPLQLARLMKFWASPTS